MAARIVVTWLPISTAESESVLAERTTLPRFLPLAEKYVLLPDRTTGSVAHFSVEVFTDNFLRQVRGEPMTGSFDGHANCFIESGDGKGLLIDLNYDTEALPGKYPVPRDRPIQPAERDRAQPLGQAGVPLDVLERPAPIPMPAYMSMAGKHTEE